MGRNVVIIGAGGHGEVVADIVRANGDTVLGFLDDSAPAVLGKIEEYTLFPDAEFFIAIGNAAIRERIAEKMPVKWYTAVHPSAVVSPGAVIGEGSAVMPNAVINFGAVIGRHCIINTAAVVEHDNRIDDYAHISVGARLGGTVHVGKSSWVGIGAVVKNNIDICAGCMIGAGAVVVKNITDNGTYVGIPVKKLEMR